jgi:hypothetical protein
MWIVCFVLHNDFFNALSSQYYSLYNIRIYHVLSVILYTYVHYMCEVNIAYL